MIDEIDEGAGEAVCGLVAGDSVTPGVDDNAVANTTMSILHLFDLGINNPEDG